jgi:hypothetical protein
MLDEQTGRMTTEEKEHFCKARFLETVRKEEEFFYKAPPVSLELLDAEMQKPRE